MALSCLYLALCITNIIIFFRFRRPFIYEKKALHFKGLNLFLCQDIIAQITKAE